MSGWGIPYESGGHGPSREPPELELPCTEENGETPEPEGKQEEKTPEPDDEGIQ